VNGIAQCVPMDTVDASRLVELHLIRDFVPQWEALIDADPDATVFQSPALFFAWHATATADEQPLMLVAAAKGEIIGCAAMVLRSRITRGIRTRVVAFANPRGDVLSAFRRDDVVRSICDWLQRHSRDWDVLELDDIRPATAEAIRQCFQRERRFDVEPLAPAPAEAFIDTSIGWDAYLQLRGAHFRHRLRPQTRRIERLGTVSLRRYAGQAAQAPYEEFLQLEPQSWKSRSGDTQLPERERAAFRHLICNADGRVDPDVLFLDVDERPVAAMLSLTHRHSYYLFVTYFDDTIRAFYPGRRLFLESILYGFSRSQVRELSFVGAYPFAQAWCDLKREYCNLKVYGSGLRARWARSFAPRAEPHVGVPASQVEHA